MLCVSEELEHDPGDVMEIIRDRTTSKISAELEEQFKLPLSCRKLVRYASNGLLKASG